MNATGRRPSRGYMLSLAIASVGLPCTAIALGAALRARAGGDPVAAFSDYGIPAFVAMYGLIFASRLIFRDKASGATQTLVRNALAAVFAAILLAWLYAALLVAQGADGGLAGAGDGNLAPLFTLFALPCEIVALLWLVRYRPE